MYGRSWSLTLTVYTMFTNDLLLIPLNEQYLSTSTSVHEVLSIPNHYINNKEAQSYKCNSKSSMTICIAGDRRLRKIHRQVTCNQCQRNVHMDCVGMTVKTYRHYMTNINMEYTCNLCAQPDLNDLFFSATYVNEPTIPPEHLNKLSSGFSLTGKRIRVASLNINHISNKQDEVKPMLQTDSRPIDVLGISETFLSQKDPDSKRINEG